MMVRLELETDDKKFTIETVGGMESNHGRKSIEIQFSIERHYVELILSEWYMSDVIPMQDYAQCPTLWDYFQTQLPHIPLQFV